MAETTSTQTSVTYRAHWSCDIWTGTADQLIAAGLVQRCQLPGEPGNKKTRVSLVNGSPVEKGCCYPKDETYLIISRISKHRYEIKKGITESEKNRRAAINTEQARIEKEKRAQQAEIENRLGFCEFLIENMHDSTDSYRQWFLERINVTLERDGYRFDALTAIKIRAHISSLISLAKNGAVILDPNARAEQIQNIYLSKDLELPTQKNKKPLLRLVKY